MRKFVLQITCLTIAAGLLTTLRAQNGVGKTQLHCEVAIIGGGAGGLHTAFRLGPQWGHQVCLFEKENRLGGRIYDVPKDENDPHSPVFGLGALRIMETQEVVFALAQELGIPYETVPFQNDLIIARGASAQDSDTLRSLAYPLVDAGEVALYDKLRFGPERANAAKYPDYRSYVRAVVGGEDHSFLTDVFRFRGDFTYPLSALSYLDFLDEDWDVCCTPSFPVGGMSAFIRGMESRAIQNGVRIYKSEPALEINSGPGASGRYEISTPHYQVRAHHLVIAVDAKAFRKVGGDVAARLQAQPQFQDIIGVKVASIDQWWPTPWWNGVVPGHRAWSTQTCVNFIEIPPAQYAADQLVTRSVFNDDLTCSDFWEITAQRGTPAVEAEIERGLKSMFPNATIPKPVKTVVKIWPAGWYWLKAGSPFTNAQIASWAIRPLPGEPVSLVGESYNPQRATWSDGAYKSSINTLNSVYGFHLTGQTATPDGPLPTFGPSRIAASSRRTQR
jgi:NAD(P)-binding Rossmann-like domain